MWPTAAQSTLELFSACSSGCVESDTHELMGGRLERSEPTLPLLMVVRRSCLPCADVCTLLPLLSLLTACGADGSRDNPAVEAATSGETQASGATSAAVPTGSGGATSGQTTATDSAATSGVAPVPTLDAAGLGSVAIQHNKSQVISRLTNAQGSKRCGFIAQPRSHSVRWPDPRHRTQCRILQFRARADLSRMIWCWGSTPWPVS